MLRDELLKLDLYSFPIGDDGAEIVADFLKHDETVKMVYLHHCTIGLRGAKAIAESLKHNQKAVLLNLLWNDLEGSKGTGALVDSLNYNVCMECLLVDPFIAAELKATIKHFTKTRNKILIPAAVRRASLCLLAARRNIIDAGNLAIFPKEIVKMIAMEVWATRREPIWINALTELERTGNPSNE